MGDVLRRAMQYLGLVAVESGDGCTIPSRRSPAYQVCDECGAVVPASRQEKHTTWHRQYVRR